MTKSWMNLTIEELREIIETNVIPDGLSWEGLDERKDFQKLFKHRTRPDMIAKTLLKEKVGTPATSEPAEIKAQRLGLQKEALEIKKMKQQNLTVMQDRILKKLQSIEAGLEMLVSKIGALERSIDDRLP